MGVIDHELNDVADKLVASVALHRALILNMYLADHVRRVPYK